jgi:hypothetical protein
MSRQYKQYTDAEKAAYYRKKASGGSSTKSYSRPAYKPYTKSAPARKYTRYNNSKTTKEPGILSAGGSALGAAIGGGPGAFLGGKIGHLVEQITGFGDYKVSQNSILKGGMGPPQIVNSINKGEVIIRHREYLGDITATKDFTVQSFLINPGLASTFPWLSQIANSYEQYKLRGVLFEFNSTSSDALLSSSTSTALGTVIMMTDYDIADLPPSSKRQMLNSEWSGSSKPSLSFIHPIECKKSLTAQNVLYTRGAIAVPANFDQRLYDFGRFNIATEGMQADGGVLGELWVTYEVSLMKQQFYYPGLTDHFRLAGVTDATTPLGVNPKSSIIAGGTLGGGLNPDNIPAYTFPINVGSGQYLINYLLRGTTAALTYAGITPTNCTILNYWVNDAYGQVSPAGGSNNVSMIALVVRVNKQGARLTWPTNVVIPGAVTGGDLWVTRIADSITTYPV